MKKFEMLNIICQDCELTAKEKLVAQYFVYKSNKAGACYPCVATIAEECSVSRRTVQRATKKLVEKEYIVKEERFKFGKQTSNLYSFNTLLLLEVESVKEEENSTCVQEMQMEVIEFSELLEVQEADEEYFEPVPEEFIQEEEEGIDLDELAASSMEYIYENDCIASMCEDTIVRDDEFPKEQGGVALEGENKKQGIQGKISFSVIMYVVAFIMEGVRTNPGSNPILIQVTLITIEKQRIISSRKIMGAFFPP